MMHRPPSPNTPVGLTKRLQQERMRRANATAPSSAGSDDDGRLVRIAARRSSPRAAHAEFRRLGDDAAERGDHRGQKRRRRRRRRDVAVDLCDAAAALHAAGDLDLAAELYDEGLGCTMDAIRDEREEAGAETGGGFDDEMNHRGKKKARVLNQEKIRDLDAAAGRDLRRRSALLRRARAELQLRAQNTDESSGAGAPLCDYLDLYDSRRRPTMDPGASSYLRPRTAARSAPRRLHAAALMHNMGLLHLHRAVSTAATDEDSKGGGERERELEAALRADRLGRAERLLRMAAGTALDRQEMSSRRRKPRRSGSAAMGEGSNGDEEEQRGATSSSRALLISALVGAGQALNESGRHGDAAEALCSALEMARQAVHGGADEDGNSAVEWQDDYNVTMSEEQDDVSMREEEEVQFTTDGSFVVSVAENSSDRVDASRSINEIDNMSRASESQMDVASPDDDSDLQELTLLALVELSRADYLGDCLEDALNDAEDALALCRAMSSSELPSDAVISGRRLRTLAAALYNAGLVREAHGDEEGAREAYAEFANLLLSRGRGREEEGEDTDDARCAHVVSALIKIIVIDCTSALPAGRRLEDSSLPPEGSSSEAECIARSALSISSLRSSRGWDSPCLISPLTSVGLALCDLGEHGTALPFLRECLRIQRGSITTPLPPSSRTDLAATLNRIGQALHGTGDWEGASGAYREALRLRLEGRKDSEQDDEGGAANHPVYLSVMYNLAAALSEGGRHGEAVRCLWLGKDMAEELVERTMAARRGRIQRNDDDGSSPNIATDEAATLAEVASVLHDAGSVLSAEYGEHADARGCLDLSLRLRRGIRDYARLSSAEATARRDADNLDLEIARTLSDDGRVLRDMRRYPDALERFSEALRIVSGGPATPTSPPRSPRWGRCTTCWDGPATP